MPGTAEALAAVLSQLGSEPGYEGHPARGWPPLLAADDAEVAKDPRKVARGDLRSPILLVRGTWLRAGRCRSRTAITGCASYHLNEDTEIPCPIADLAADAAE